MSTPTPANCSGLANSDVPAKAPGIEIAPSVSAPGSGLGQTKVDDLCGHSASVLQAHHDVTWFDVAVNEFLLVDRGQTLGDLRRHFQRQLHLDPARALDEILERFPFYKLHRVKVILTGFAQMED
jgi:hypothetical protein